MLEVQAVPLYNVLAHSHILKEIKFYSTNTISTQINIIGWKQVNNSNGLTAYVNESLKLMSIQLSKSFTFSSAGTEYEVVSLPSNYSSKHLVTFRNANDERANVWVSGNKIRGVSGSIGTFGILIGGTFPIN